MPFDHWLSLAGWPLIVVTVGAIALIAVSAIFWIGLAEKRPLRTWRPESPLDPPFESPYVDTMNAQAAEHGFVVQGWFRLTTTGRLKFRAAFWLAPNRDALAIVAHGAAGPLKQRRTLLISSLDGGGYVVTTDDFGEADISAVAELGVLLNADFGELVEHHWQRLARTILPLLSLRDQPEAEYFRLESARRQELLRRRRARLLDDHWKYTLRGAVALAIATIRMQLRATRQLDRSKLPRPGDAQYTPRYNVELPEAEV